MGKGEIARHLLQTRKNQGLFGKGLNYIVTIIIAIATIELSCGECRARSDCSYVQSDLALHFSMLNHLSTLPE